MKFLILLIFSLPAMANIPMGNYQVEKIECKNSKKVLKLGGKFMIYTINLKVDAGVMTMTAIANSGSWAPFTLNCTQINQGKFVYTKENTYEGELANISASCNNALWTNILKKKLFGVEEYGEFTYKMNGNKLEIFNPKTITKYSCTTPSDYPVYYYKKN